VEEGKLVPLKYGKQRYLQFKIFDCQSQTATEHFGFSSFRVEQMHARGGGGPRQKYTEEND